MIFQVERDKDKVSTEEIEEAFETFKEKRDAVHEFEVELAEHQIEKLVDEGVYIKVAFGVKQSGLIFIPNYQLDIIEEDNQKKYKSISERQPHILSITKNIRIRISILKGEP